jgi:hypothetical protein
MTQPPDGSYRHPFLERGERVAGARLAKLPGREVAARDRDRDGPGVAGRLEVVRRVADHEYALGIELAAGAPPRSIALRVGSPRWGGLQRYPPKQKNWVRFWRERLMCAAVSRNVTRPTSWPGIPASV